MRKLEESGRCAENVEEERGMKSFEEIVLCPHGRFNRSGKGMSTLCHAISIEN